MANLNRKWGAVIACWCVALVMIITGVCLGLTIPSSAAEDDYDGDIAVMFDANGDGVIGEDESTIYHTMHAAIEVVNDLPTEKGKEATIKLLSNVMESYKNLHFKGAHCTIDLNGYVWTMGTQILMYGGSLTITDSRSEDVVRYFTYVGDNKYEYTDKELIGHFGTPVKGGVIMTKEPLLFTISVLGSDAGEDYGDAELILDGGTYLGGMDAIWLQDAKLEIHDGVNLQFYFDNDVVGEGALNFTGTCSIVNQGETEVEIKGGNIYGQILAAEFDENGNMNKFITVDLTDKTNLPEWVTIDSAIKMVEKEIEGMKVYSAVPADSVTEEPITKPTEPIAEAEPTNNNNNLIALIVLGAAAAVMVVGVTVIIMVNAKRRKKVA